MGYYIQTGTLKQKAEAIVAKMGGELLTSPPESFSSIPDGKALIVVIDNGMFEAAGLVYSAGDRDDLRRKKYVLMDQARAFTEANFPREGYPKSINVRSPRPAQPIP
jgi:hypothetical protein